MKTPLRNVRHLWIVLASVAFAALTLQAAFAVGQPAGSYEWVLTPEAAVRTAAGECYVEGAEVQEVCVQWCLVTIEGYVIPQDEFRCLPYFD